MSWLSKAVKKAKKAVKKAVSSGGIVGAVVGVATGIGALAGIAGALGVNKIVTGSKSKNGVTKAVDQDVIMAIPAMDITFEGNLLKPNTRIYVFFDGKNVTPYIQPDGQNTGDPLYSDGTGHIKGTFHLPSNENMYFTLGTKQMKFTDSQKNDNTETTYAFTSFTYTGCVGDEDLADVGGLQASENRVDPVVQSFMVLDKGGIYLKSVDLYFLTKDAQFPVLFQVREVVEDTVSNSYIANSNVILRPADIAADDQGNTPTRVTLDSPIFLQEGKEYAIYLVTNAPATYNLATCIYGETNAYNQLSTKDPRLGGLMKNLGGDAWLKDTSKGIKFILYKCAFDTTQKYTLALDNENLSTKILDNNSLSTTDTTNIITVTDPDHSFNVGDYVTISGLPDDTVYGGINSDYINGIHKITEVTINQYKFDNVIISGTETAIPTDATSSISFGLNVSSDTSYQYDTLIINNNDMLFSNTKLDYKVKGLSGRSIDGSETPNVFDPDFIEISNQVDYNTAKVKKINSPYNEQNLNAGGAKSLQLNAEFSTTNENISPVIDVWNTNAILIENVINNQYDEGELTDQNLKGVARYITNDVSLSTQSNGVQVRFSANIQGDSQVRVFYKILTIESQESLSTQPWVEMQLDNDVAKASNNSVFNNYIYTVYNLPLFKAFKTKVLMTATDSTKPPLLKEYKAIALQSMDND